MKRVLDTELNQIARTATYSKRLHRLDDLTALLATSADDDAKRLERVLTDIVGVANVIPLESQVLTESIRYQQTHDFSPQDALVHASIISDLTQHDPGSPSCFLNRNSKDFDNQNVVDELQRHQCRLFPGFDSGLNFILTSLE